MKSDFVNFLQVEFPDRAAQLLILFERLHELLTDANRRINIISRKIPPVDYWTIHFLDSILPFKYIKKGDKKVLDFGTGGGLPGIPLKIIHPGLEMYLLDSRFKKIEVVKNIIKKLDLSGCFTIVSRLEEIDDQWDHFFDCIVSRSVRVTPKLFKKMQRMLSDEGEIILYKSHKPEDLSFIESRYEVDVSHSGVGRRKIIKITKQDIQ
jgi:16S rRNA (guanine527-N7)-methyltransferase